MPTCRANPAHVYPAHNKKCPWCEAERRAKAPPQVTLPKVAAPTAAPPAPAPYSPPRPVPAARVPTVRSRRNVKESFKKFGLLVVGSAIVWLFTPVVASFGTLAIPNLSTAVFAADENNGRTAADSPDTLYAHLAWLLVFFCVAILVMDLVFGPEPKFEWLVPIAVVGGLVAFFWQVIANGGQLWQWDILPIAVVAAYLLAQLFTWLRERVTP